MDPKLFKEKIHQLGQLRRKYSGNSPLNAEAYEDQVFEKFPGRCKICARPNVQNIIFIKIHLENSKKTFIHKCQTCKKVW